MDQPTPTDATLMAELAKGQIDALAELIHRHQDEALKLAFRLLQRWDLAEDVVQEAFIRVHRGAGGFRAEARFRTWFYRILVNLCIDEERRNVPLMADVDRAYPDGRDPQMDPLVHGELIAMIRSAIAGLPDRQRTALVLQRYHGMSHRQIAGITGWTESAVESLIVRALANLRKKLTAVYNEYGR